MQDRLEDRVNVPYTSYDSSSLNYNHNFVLLVDDGREGEFGGEIELRANIERVMKEKYHVPVVCIVVQVDDV